MDDKTQGSVRLNRPTMFPILEIPRTHVLPAHLPHSFSISSELPLPAEVVWRRVSTMDGVNAELMPWMRMTVPRGEGETSLMEAPIGEDWFSSWLLLGGLFPMDRHTFQMESVEDCRFQEHSSSTLQAIWRHEREIIGANNACRVIDTVAFLPRLPLVGPLTLWIAKQVFTHRHRQLVQWAKTEA